MIAGLAGLGGVPDPSPAAPAVDAGRVSALLEELKALLEASDSRAVHVAEALAEAVKGSAFETATARLVSAIDVFDYDSALELMAKLSVPAA